MTATIAVLLLLVADAPPTPLGAEMQLMREIEAEEARAAKEQAVRPPPPQPAVAQQELAPPPGVPGRGAEAAFRLEFGVPFTWRAADVTPASGTGIRYRKGGAPYPGIALATEVFPARADSRLPVWLAPVGLAAAFQYGFLSTEVSGKSYGSSEQRAALDLLYERRLRAGTRLGGRLGYSLHRFGVDPDAAALTSRRHGPRLGFDALQALSRRLDALAGARVMPWFGTSGPEASAHGGASGWGFELLAGLEGPLPVAPVSGLGWRTVYDVARFADRFESSGGTLSRGGTGSALHHEIALSLIWRR